MYSIMCPDLAFLWLVILKVRRKEDENNCRNTVKSGKISTQAFAKLHLAVEYTLMYYSNSW
jgi:hypothetical protein